MSEKKHQVAIIGCGRMGQIYADAYTTYPDTEIVAIVESNSERRRVVGERFGVSALFENVGEMLAEVVPEIVSVVTPVKYMKEAVVTCAEAGVKGITVDKPVGGVLADADAMVEACASREIVFGGGNLQRAMHEVQEAARRIRSGAFGEIIGASVNGWGGEIVGGGCQHISVLRLLADAEVEEVIAWGMPEAALGQEDDSDLIINGQFTLSSGLICPVFGKPTPRLGVEVWSEDSLVSWDWGPPEIFRGFDEEGKRIAIDPGYATYEWDEFNYLTGALRSFLAALETGSKLWVSGHDLRQALEVAIATKVSVLRGSAPVKLPLEDRSLSLYPRPYRWIGGDFSGSPQSVEEAAGEK
jgi:predicted dehydrogenase